MWTGTLFPPQVAVGSCHLSSYVISTKHHHPQCYILIILITAQNGPPSEADMSKSLIGGFIWRLWNAQLDLLWQRVGPSLSYSRKVTRYSVSQTVCSGKLTRALGFVEESVKVLAETTWAFPRLWRTFLMSGRGAIVVVRIFTVVAVYWSNGEQGGRVGLRGHWQSGEHGVFRGGRQGGKSGSTMAAIAVIRHNGHRRQFIFLQFVLLIIISSCCILLIIKLIVFLFCGPPTEGQIIKVRLQKGVQNILKKVKNITQVLFHNSHLKSLQTLFLCITKVIFFPVEHVAFGCWQR